MQTPFKTDENDVKIYTQGKRGRKKQRRNHSKNFFRYFYISSFPIFS